MAPWEVAVAQAEMSGHLIRYTQAPIAKKTRVRGVLPGADGTPVVRIAVGRRKAVAGEFHAMYEIPLFRQDEMLSPWAAVDLVRHEVGEVRFRSSGQVDDVLGTPLVRLSGVVPGKERLEDRAYTLLTTLSCPPPSFEERESAESLLVGFVYQRGGGMRLYVRHQDNPGVIGCDVRLAEAGPAVMAEVFSRSGERELWGEPEGDPHCVAVLDLRH